MTRINNSKTVEWNLANMAVSDNDTSSIDTELANKVSQTVTEVASLEKQVASINIATQTLELNDTTLKISKGNSVTLPTDWFFLL